MHKIYPTIIMALSTEQTNAIHTKSWINSEMDMPTKRAYIPFLAVTIQIISIIFLICINSSQAWSQSLIEAVHQSLMTHPEVLLNEAQTRAAFQGIAEAKGSYYPAINMNAGHGREWTESPVTIDLAGNNATTLNRSEFDVSLVQNIFAGGAIVGEVQRNRFIYKAQFYRTLSTANDMALNVVDAYLNVLLQQELVRVNQRNVSELKRLYLRIKERTDSGVAKAAELVQAQSRVSLAESDLISAEGALRQAAVRYRKYVGCWPQDLKLPFVPKKNSLPKTLERAIQEGSTQNPLMKAVTMDINQALAERKVANGAFAPRVDALVSATRNENIGGLPGRNFNNLGVIRVSYNLFKGGGDLGRARKAAYLVQQAYETRNKTLVNLKESIRLAFNDWQVNTKRYLVLAVYVTSTEQTKAAYYEQFQIGQRTLLDLLNTQNEENRAKTEYLQSRKDEYIARFRILNNIGGLINFMKQTEKPQGKLAPYSLASFRLPKQK
jgi:adhesin transport system outer membrane protein